MKENIAAILAQEAEEAESRADAEERGEQAPLRGQRARRQGSEATQVYTVRIPVDRLEELRVLAARLDVPPSVLLRRWALERLDLELGRGQPAGLGTQPDYPAIARIVSAAVNRAVAQAVRNIFDGFPGLQEAVRRTPEADQDRYLDPAGPVRLGPTRRLAADLSPTDILLLPEDDRDLTR
ncbi:MAG TPA: hypothetical protein VFM55_20015 [Micromonosporaceae bacterium]|nr:hypothetical protein [Micromonosporaceae bacterium]